jgi:CheY-like chemotaxis protein
MFTSTINEDKTEQTGRTASVRPPATLLLVDDDPLIREMTAAMLAARNYRILQAESAHAAIEIWREALGGVDLLFADYNLNCRMSGAELGLHLRRTCPDLPIILTSGGLRPNIPNTFHWLPKPYSMARLHSAVEAVLLSRIADVAA